LWDSGLLYEPLYLACLIDIHHSKAVCLLNRNRGNPHGDIGSRSLVEGDHPAIVHFIYMVGSQYQHQVSTISLDVGKVLIDSIGRALI